MTWAVLTEEGVRRFEEANAMHQADIHELFGFELRRRRAQDPGRAARPAATRPGLARLLGGRRVSHAHSSLDELGDGPGFRKIRAALGVTAFGINALVLPPGHDGFLHYHDVQDELYFVHRGRVSVEVDGETVELGEGGLLHVSSTTPRKVSNPFAEEAVVLALGGKDGYVERDGHMVDAADAERRTGFGKS